MHLDRILKLSQCCLLAVGLGMAPLGYWAARVKFGTALVQDWLPANDPVLVRYREFTEHFGNDQFLLVSWSDCRLDDPALVLLTERFEQLSKSAPELGIQHVLSSLQSVQDLERGALRLTRQQAISRLSGQIIGQDGTCFITLRVRPAPVAERAELIGRVKRTAAEVLGDRAQSLILAGEPYQVYLIDRSSRETMQYFVVPSSLVALLFAWMCLRRLPLTLMVFALAGSAQLIGLALVSLVVGEISAVLVVLPTLLFMLTLSAAIHLTTYYVDCLPGAAEAHAVTEQRWAGAAALRLGIRPCVLASLTTAFGFVSLAVSSLAPVWQFGALAAVGLVLATATLLVSFPAATAWLPRRAPPGRIGDKALAIHKLAPNLRLRMEGILSATTRRHATPISLVGVVLLLFALLGVGRLGTSTEFQDMFPQDSPSVKGLHWVGEHLGPLDSLEFLIRIPRANGDNAGLLSQARLVAGVHRHLESHPRVHSAMSATTFLPPLPTGRGMRSTIQRAVLKRKLADGLAQEQSWFSTTDQDSVWRISARISDLRGDNYLELRGALEAYASAHLTELSTSDTPSTAELEITGLKTVIEKAHASLLADLGSSFLAAFLMITPVMMLIVRGVVSGLILMIPNILPVAFVFGCMGWLGVRLDVASILTASVALGIAVDDTLHFVSWYLRSRQTGDPPHLAVRAAISACARPMFHTTVICTGAMLPFFFSSFLPTSKFALLMILILSGAIVGDLILLPAILQTPIGRWVGRTASKRMSEN